MNILEQNNNIPFAMLILTFIVLGLVYWLIYTYFEGSKRAGNLLALFITLFGVIATIEVLYPRIWNHWAGTIVSLIIFMLVVIAISLFYKKYIFYGCILILASILILRKSVPAASYLADREKHFEDSVANRPAVIQDSIENIKRDAEKKIADEAKRVRDEEEARIYGIHEYSLSGSSTDYVDVWAPEHANIWVYPPYGEVCYFKDADGKLFRCNGARIMPIILGDRYDLKAGNYLHFYSNKPMNIKVRIQRK